MSVDQESTDALLGRWAELLRSRDALCTMNSSEFLVRYGTPRGATGEYVARAGETGLLNDMIDLFLKDIDISIAEIEASLRMRGIEVKRPPPRTRS